MEQLIASVASQTIPPAVWVIVSDGSTDRTDEIVRAQGERHPWIRLLRRERDASRNFAGKAHAVNAGYQLLAAETFDVVGNLDADITLPPDYYEFLLKRLAEAPELGVIGTPYIDDGDNQQSHTYAHRMADLTHVSGACQFFRRPCFDEIGGYMPIKGGGIDWVAVTMARLRGWQTRTFLDRVCLHHRAMGTADRGPLSARFRHGQEDFFVGSHPLWHTMRGVFQMKNKPIVLGGLSLILGYGWAWISRKPSPIPQELRAFHRREQLQRLRRLAGAQSAKHQQGTITASHILK
jgi:glycosyltransferase involved in cell wall biosynthesis